MYIHVYVLTYNHMTEKNEKLNGNFVFGTTTWRAIYYAKCINSPSGSYMFVCNSSDIIGSLLLTFRIYFHGYWTHAYLVCKGIFGLRGHLN